MRAKVTQQRLADVTGLSKRTIRRLEQGEIEHPPLAYYVNCAIALELDLTEVLDADDLDWTAFDKSKAPKPPKKGWHRREEWLRPRGTQ
jgi:transcriptional regulator with XRE-family HTH domain